MPHNISRPSLQLQGELKTILVNLLNFAEEGLRVGGLFITCVVDKAKPSSTATRVAKYGQHRLQNKALQHLMTPKRRVVALGCGERTWLRAGIQPQIINTMDLSLGIALLV